MHELGLLYYSYLLKKEGWKVIYLGQMVPLPDVKKAMAHHKPDYLLTSFVNQTKEGWVDNYLKGLLNESQTVHILSSGIQSAYVTIDSPRLTLLSHVKDLANFTRNI